MRRLLSIAALSLAAVVAWWWATAPRRPLSDAWVAEPAIDKLDPWLERVLYGDGIPRGLHTELSAIDTSKALTHSLGSPHMALFPMPPFEKGHHPTFIGGQDAYERWIADWWAWAG